MKRAPRRAGVKGEIVWKAFRDPESDRWIAYCDPLALTADGDMWSELQENISEAMNLLFVDLLEDGDLDGFLRRHGWALVVAGDLRPKEEIEWDIPYDIRREAYASAT